MACESLLANYFENVNDEIFYSIFKNGAITDPRQTNTGHDKP